MSKISSIIFILLFINSSFIFSQEDFFKSVIEPLQKDNIQREKVFIHLNKTTYFNNENIWFTAYVAEDFHNTPSANTTNLSVNLINDKGDLIERKNLFIKNGIGFGDFKIEDNFKSGKYFIHGLTNHMQNFGPENAYVQEIEIINPSTDQAPSKILSTNNYDLQVFPESGYLLEGAENVIGIKALVNGKGLPYLGKIVNSAGVEITSFKGNIHGMGKCKFTYLENDKYTAVIEINNTLQKINIPPARKTGIIFSLDNSDFDKIILTLKTNKVTLPSLINESLVLLFYRNNYICDAITLSLKNDLQTTQELLIDKSKMLHGVNVVTLFRDHQPVAERKFFVDRQDQQTATLIEELKSDNDSIKFKITTIDPHYKSISAQLSLSILPSETKVFNETQNIKSAFLLTPYVKGKIEDPSYYFKHKDPNEKEYLDLLLLNQGWSIYSLKEKILEINPPKNYNFENGFTLRGTIKKFPKDYNIGILSKKNNIIAFSAINDDNEFTFENIFAYKNDSVKIALIKKNQPLVKPQNIKFIEPLTSPKRYDYLTKKYHTDLFINDPNNTSVKEQEFNPTQYPETQLLDEIVLKTIVPKKMESNIYDLEMGLANKHNIVSAASYKGKKVTEQMETIYQSLFDYFRNLGYIKPAPSNQVDSYFISLRSGPATIMDYGGTANPDGTFPPRIFIDDILQNRNNNIEILKELSMRHVDEILINRSGAGGGADGTGGMIKIYLKKGDHQYFGSESKKLYESLVLLTGYDKSIEYYKPQYNIYSKEIYNWTEIDWKYSIETNETGEAFIKIPKEAFNNKFLFIINGFSANGLLFHDVYDTGNEEF